MSLEIKINEIYNYDCVEFTKLMDENCVDLTVTSPPYDNLRNYKGYNFDFESVAKGLFRVTKKGGIAVWVVGDKITNGNRTLTSFKHAIFFQDCGFNVHDVMIYKKKIHLSCARMLTQIVMNLCLFSAKVNLIHLPHLLKKPLDKV